MKLLGKRIAILAESLYQEVELWVPYYRMLEEGAKVQIIGANGIKEYKSSLGYPVKVDLDVSETKSGDFDGIIIPGGYSPDKMRLNKGMVQLVSELNSSGKLIAAICHAGWMLASAHAAQGRRLTSCPSIRDDLVNAGAQHVNESVVVDGNLITSRGPNDLPDFCREIVSYLSK